MEELSCRASSREGKHVYAEIVRDCARKRLHAIIYGRIVPSSIIHWAP